MNPEHDADLPTRDLRFNAAWRRVSNEEPPSGLDDAIRAAARRELDAGPRASDVALREARRPERWWFPLAAAAAIGAIALGLLQIVGPDRLPVAGSPAVVSDIPPGTTIPTPPVVASPASPAGLTIEARPPASHTPPAAARAPAFVSRDAASPLPAAADSASARSEPRRHASPAASASAAGTARGVPPPATAPSIPSAEPTLDAAAPGGGRTAAEQAPSVAAPAAKLAPDAPERRRLDSEARASAARAILPPAEWIALIRRLRDEGRTEEAARELAAFRAAHPDHETLLPPDLVRWRADAR
jgi:hypothetical protein